MATSGRRFLFSRSRCAAEPSQPELLFRNALWPLFRRNRPPLGCSTESASAPITDFFAPLLPEELGAAGGRPLSRSAEDEDELLFRCSSFPRSRLRSRKLKG